MSAFDVIKDCVSIAQKADNIPLVEKLIEAQKQILDLLDENRELKEKIRAFDKTAAIEPRIVRHKDAVITLSEDTEELYYCACCWDKDRKLIQVQRGAKGKCQCPACKSVIYYDKELYDKSQSEAIRQLSKGIRV